MKPAIGEKLVNAIFDSPHDHEIAQELPDFAVQIRTLFTQDELKQWFATVRRIGALGHTTTDEEFAAFRIASDVDQDIVRGAVQAIAFERARELLLVSTRPA